MCTLHCTASIPVITTCAPANFSTAHPGMASHMFFFFPFVLILCLMRAPLRNELGFMFDQKGKKGEKEREKERAKVSSSCAL